MIMQEVKILVMRTMPARSEPYDRIIHTGDCIGQGLYPAECLDLLRDNQVELISGGSTDIESSTTYINPGSLGLKPGSFTSYCMVSVTDAISYKIVNLPYDKDGYVNDLVSSDFPNRHHIACILSLRPETPFAEAVQMMNEVLRD